MSIQSLRRAVGRRVALPGVAVLLTTTAIVVAGPAPGAAAAAICSDTTGPKLTAFARTPGAVNVKVKDKTVTITAHATDDLSGVAGIYVSLTSPAKHGVSRSTSAYLRRVSGTPTSGGWKGTATIHRWTINGSWHVTSVYLNDRVNNYTYVSQSQLQSAGYATALKVASNPDLIKPTAKSFSLKPKSVNTRSGKKTVKVAATIKDKGGSGVSGGYVSFGRSGPGGSYGTGTVLSRKRGTSTYVGTMTVPKFADAISPAKWKISLFVQDKAGNYTSYDAKAAGRKHWPTTLKVTTTPDAVAPKLTGVSVSPGSVDVSTKSGKVTVTATATDRVSGTRSVSVRFTDSVSFSSLTGYLTLKSGTGRNGTWKGSIHVPLCYQAGTYVVSNATLYDTTGNYRNYDPGFTDSFKVTS